MATVQVHIRMKKKPKSEAPSSRAPEELPPSYEEALMMPDAMEVPLVQPDASPPNHNCSGDMKAAQAAEAAVVERDELSMKSLRSQLLRLDSAVYRRRNSINEVEEGDDEEPSPDGDNDGDEQSYLDDEHAFEAYEDDQEQGGHVDEGQLLHDLDESELLNKFAAAEADDRGERVERTRHSEDKESTADRSRPKAQKGSDSNNNAVTSAPVACIFDENTYAIISRLRAANKSLSTQLEKQLKSVAHLQEERKQHLQTIQTLRADLQMHKQALKGFQTHGRRPFTGDDALNDQSVRPPSTVISTLLPQVTGMSSPRSGSSSHANPHNSPRKGNLLLKAADAETRAREHPPKPFSPRVSSQPLSPKRPLVLDPRSPAASGNNSNTHVMQQLLEKYAAKLEKVEQEKKETQIRHGHQLANYSHELSRLERQLDHAHKLAQEKENELRLQKTRQLYTHSGTMTSAIGSGPRHLNDMHLRGLLADSFWKDLTPPNFSGSLSTHIGLAFEQLLSHQMVSLHDHSLDASTRDWLRELRVCGGQMLQLHKSFQAMSCTFQRLAESSHLYQFAETLSRESRELLSAEQSLVFIVDTAEQEFWCRVPRAADSKDMITVRSKLMPFATAGHAHHPPSTLSQPIGDLVPPLSSAIPASPQLNTGGLPSGLASMVFHTKRPLLLEAGHITKHPCYSTASDNTDRMISHPSASTLLLPLMHHGHALGVIQLCGKTTIVEALGLSIALEKCDAFTVEDQALLHLLCHFASGLLPKVTYFTEVESNKVNEETLIQLAPEIFTCLRFEELGKIVIQNAKEILDADRCSLFVADTAERTLHNWQSDISGGTVQVYDNAKKTGMTIPFGHGIVGLVAETSQAINIPDAYDDPRFNSSWDKKTNYRTKSMLAVPILTNTTKRQPIRHASHFNGDRFGATAGANGAPAQPQQGQKSEPNNEQVLLGVVQVINKSGGAPFRAKDEFLLKTITKLIALAIENSQLFQKNQELCSNLGKLIANADLVEAVISLGTSAEDIIGVESAAIYVYDHLAQEMVTFHRKRRHKIMLKEQMYRSSLFGDAVRTKDLVIVNNLSEVPHFNAYVDSIAGINARNVLFAPLVIEDPDAIGLGGGTKLVGLMHLVNTKGRKISFERHDLFLSIVTSMCCSVIASIMEKQVMLKQKEQTNLLLDTSMSFFKEMSPIGVINAVYNACTSIFNVEKAHLFLWEPDKRHMWTSKLLPHAEANTGGGGAGSSFSSSSGASSNAGSSSVLSGVLNPSTNNQIPSLGSQLRRISVLTDQKLRVPTTEGLLEQVLVKGTVLLVKHWVEGFEAEKEERGAAARDDGQRVFAGAFRKYMLRITASDEKIGFVKHSVVACPVWDNFGLEIVGILVLLFPKGRAPSLTELTNLPILCRQISGALNVCSDLGAVSTRSKKLQSMLEMSMKKPTLALSLTLSARGQLVTFSQPVNLLTAGFNASTLAASVHASTALNITVRSLPMDEDGNRWGFQISAASVHEMNSEHYVKWIGKDLNASQLFDKLRTDLQSVYVRKEPMSGEINRNALKKPEHDNALSGGEDLADNHEQLKPSSLARRLSNRHHSLPKAVVFEIRKLLWEFVDSSWRVDIRCACQIFDPVDPNRQRRISRKHLEQILSTGGRNVRLDQIDWDLLHTFFADPNTDLVNVEQVFESLAPQIHVVPHFAYEIVPILDTITQTVVNIHIILTAVV